VLTLVCALGLLLSAVGLYGVATYGVRQRARELGIRMALGARPADVRRLVLRQGFAILGGGTLVGGAASIAATRLLRHALFGATWDPVTMLAVCGILLAAGSAALCMPARWASRLEPVRTLRMD
jgi:ABC-type antimicrobial peptide transport system permease subunit